MWAELRRGKRKRIDAVGWMPWNKIFFACALAGLAMLAMGIKGWVSG